LYAQPQASRTIVLIQQLPDPFDGFFSDLNHAFLLEERAQNGHDVKRPALRAKAFRCCLAARSRALCTPSV
jgi:hypothetical protein